MTNKIIKECPNHEGAFDCTPFCRICEGEQEYEYNGFLPCTGCGIALDEDIWHEELGMCLECSNTYFGNEN